MLSPNLDAYDEPLKWASLSSPDDFVPASTQTQNVPIPTPGVQPVPRHTERALDDGALDAPILASSAPILPHILPPGTPYNPAALLARVLGAMAAPADATEERASLLP